MSLKLILLISTILLFASSYETEGDVLVLGDSDFPQVLEDHPFILVEFYAPWYTFYYSGVDTANTWLQSTKKLPPPSKNKDLKVPFYLFS